ncbi:MAG TPA: tetratricopeptide repeat protein, partial [Bacillota bacterium]|nr:tetratricopeptide repeat protein [Bacillota bacterium]
AQSPLDKAQELVYQAWEEPSPKRRLTLAKRALKVSPECADAYLLLAQEAAGNPGQQRKLYEQAVAAAERALGPEVFRNCAGHFWGVLETRPYMRARASLGQCLWSLGEPAAAIEQYQALLKLNPNDNQGNRYILSDYLLAEGRDEEFKALLKRFPSDIAAGWSYNRALWLFRTEGPGRKATNALRAALTANPFVPDYLLGAKALPAFLPPFVGMGDENEAIEYASRALENWHKTPYAVDWLRENAE